jgi:hypothetical protein
LLPTSAVDGDLISNKSLGVLLHVPPGLRLKILRSAHRMYLCFLMVERTEGDYLSIQLQLIGFYYLAGVFTARYE